ncbi:hypothetical protein TSH7_17175 [Azospirillum sp. TSH7]|uniref:hypothetical protein n=1 Tax=unclassified Azospirillum TaxID=2630922 RepID=UPI000D60C451|nr:MULTISPECIES: hypothetical protein [unclassified Azospirillum]PWC61183.1 hypothetical protein TSH7_17175 [Azospirillum sp. TSH7]PWC62042.1 hypothetical protein TSH20_22395 [Azospirillum sp. TSH20]
MSAPDGEAGRDPGRESGHDTVSGRHRDRMIGLFLLAAALFNPPLLGLFGVEGRVLGVPALYVWVFGLWVAVIALAALAGRKR